MIKMFKKISKFITDRVWIYDLHPTYRRNKAGKFQIQNTCMGHDYYYSTVSKEEYIIDLHEALERRESFTKRQNREFNKACNHKRIKKLVKVIG